MLQACCPCNTQRKRSPRPVGRVGRGPGLGWGEGPATLHAAVDPRAIRTRAKLAQAQMAPLMGMSLSGYRREQGQRRVSGPAATLLRVIAKEPAAVRRALTG